MWSTVNVRGFLRWWVTMAAFTGLMFGVVIAIGAVLAMQPVPALIAAAVAAGCWAYLNRLPTFTPRNGGPGSWL